MNGKNIIAAVRTDEELMKAITSGTGLIFYLAPNLMSLADFVKKAHQNNKKLLCHIDLAEGLGKDKTGLIYLKSIGVDGIISTRVSIIKAAKEAGLFSVQRFFIVDSHSVATTVESAKASKADMIEIMPGVVPKVIAEIKKQITVPIIAGGLIETAEEIEAAFKNGAIGISTGKQEFW